MFPNRPLVNQFVHNHQQQQNQNSGYQGNQPQQQNQYGGYQGNQPQQQNQYQGNQQRQQQQNYQQQQQRQQQQYQQQQNMMNQQMQQQQNMMNQQMQMMNNMNQNMMNNMNNMMGNMNMNQNPNQNNMMYGQLTTVNYGTQPKQQNMQQQNMQQQNYQQQQQRQQQQQNTNNNNNNNTNTNSLNKNLSTSKYSNVQRDQPLAGAQPSLKPLKDNKSYTENDANQDADTLYKAFKGMGSDKKTIMMVAGRRTTYQRVMIKRAYNKKYGQKEGFIKRLKSETSGKFENILVQLFKDAGFIDAMVIHDSMEGMGFNTDQLLEVLVTRTNQEIEDMKTVYQKKFKEPLEKRVGKETKKSFGNNNFQKFCLKILEGKRPQSGNDNENAVKEDAEILNRQLNQSKKDEAKATFVRVFTERSWSHLNALAGMFQQISKKYTLTSAIQHAFGKSSDTSKGMQYIVDFVTQPYDFWAKRFVKSMEGMGTNDKLLQRLVITRCEIDLFSIQQIFGQRYGKGKTLKNWIENDCSGNYEKILLILCGYVD